MSIVLNGTTGITAPDIDVTAQTTVAAFDAGITLGGSATTLDDYEEGTWTPASFASWTTNPTFDEASYIKIGNLVTLTLYFTTGVTGTNARFQGLPFSDGLGVGAGVNGSINFQDCVFVSSPNIWFTAGSTDLAGTRFTVTYRI